MSDSFLPDDESDSFLPDDEEAFAGTRSRTPSVLDRTLILLNPAASFRGAVGSRIASDVQTGKDLFGQTALGKFLSVGTSPVLKAPVDRATSPDVVAPTVQEALNPINWLGVKTATATGKAVTKPIGTKLELGRIPSITQPNPMREHRLLRIRGRILQAPRLAGHQFEQRLDELASLHPDQVVDLSGVAQTIQEAGTRNPAFLNLWQRAVRNSKASAKVQSILNQPEVASNLTLKESQEVKRVFQQLLKAKFQQVSPELFDAHLDAMDAWHGIREAQVRAFPEFDDIAQGYHQVLSKFRLVKPMLKEGRLEPKILENFGGNTEVLKALREIITPDTIRMMEGLRKASGFRQTLGWLAKAGIVGAAGAVGAGLAGRTAIKILTGRE